MKSLEMNNESMWGVIVLFPWSLIFYLGRVNRHQKKDDILTIATTVEQGYQIQKQAAMENKTKTLGDIRKGLTEMLFSDFVMKLWRKSSKR